MGDGGDGAVFEAEFFRVTIEIVGAGEFTCCTFCFESEEDDVVPEVVGFVYWGFRVKRGRLYSPRGEVSLGVDLKRT